VQGIASCKAGENEGISPMLPALYALIYGIRRYVSWRIKNKKKYRKLYPSQINKRKRCRKRKRPLKRAGASL
jgi:hypothetical protein